MKKIKLLLIDSCQLFLEGVKLALSQENIFHIVGAYINPNEAFKKISVFNPDLIITDLVFTEINGDDFIKKLKKLFPKIKILVVSNSKNNFIQKFVDGSVNKNICSYDLIQTIKKKIIINKINPDLNTNTAQEINKRVLTKREREIITLISNELTVYEIADTLFISKHTVESHKKNIYSKLKVKSSAGLIKKAIYSGIISAS